MPAVILYELNEVPWQIVDQYVERHPDSHVARLVASAECLTTHNADPDHLSPWGTWPTFHKGMHRAEHNVHQLGQDPETFRGTDMWEVVEAAGKKVGLFGALQTWPPREFAHGGFYVPDTFARTPATLPASLEAFQAFNLSMTSELGFSADRALDMPTLAKAGMGMLLRGLTPWSARRLTAQLARERREPRYKAARSIMQALPAFDLYFRLHRKVDPALSIFFTNHVAGMMHRFWGDGVPGYAEANGYDADPVYAGFIDEAMGIFDHQLGRILRYLERRPDTVLVVAASMGQGPVPYKHVAETYVVEDAKQFATALGLPGAAAGLAMYPMYALELESEAEAGRAAELLKQIEVGGRPLIDEVTVLGSSVSYRVRAEVDGENLVREVRFVRSGQEPVDGVLEDFGLATAQRLGGGNTAYHVPDGIYITYGAGIAPDSSRASFDVRDAASRVLGHLSLAEEWEAARGV